MFIFWQSKYKLQYLPKYSFSGWHAYLLRQLKVLKRSCYLNTNNLSEMRTANLRWTAISRILSELAVLSVYTIDIST